MVGRGSLVRGVAERDAGPTHGPGPPPQQLHRTPGVTLRAHSHTHRGGRPGHRATQPGHAVKQKATKALKTQLTLLATLENARTSNRHTHTDGAYSKITLT